MAATQVDRLDSLVANISRRVEETAATVQQTILQPARDGLALLSTLKNVIASFRDLREPRAPQEPPEPDEARSARPAAHRGGRVAPDDDLFIG
jgi:hypothetical protein